LQFSGLKNFTWAYNKNLVCNVMSAPDSLANWHEGRVINLYVP